MNGAVKSYRINCPMNWAEYKCLPDDLRIAYIRGLRRTYGAKDSTIFDMLGVSRSTGCLEVKRLGISPGKTAGIKFDREGWEKWLGRGEDETEAEEPVIDEPEAEEPVIDELPSAKIVSFSEQDWITLHLNLGMLNGYALVCDQHVGDRIRAITQAILEMLN